MPKKKTVRKKRAALSAEDLKPGVRFKYGAFYGRPSAGVEILRGRESGTSAFGLSQDRWWSRNLDTGEEGYVVLGPGGILNVDEVLDAGESGPPRHHAAKKSPAQLDREIAEALSRVKAPRRTRSHATRKSTPKASKLSDIEPGLRNVAQRSIDAENRFLAYAMEHGRLSRDQAKAAMAAFRKARVIKFDAVSGTFHVKHGQFLDPDVLRRAAGVEE